jgi:hypothetical protein
MLTRNNRAKIGCARRYASKIEIDARAQLVDSKSCGHQSHATVEACASPLVGLNGAASVVHSSSLISLPQYRDSAFSPGNQNHDLSSVGQPKSIAPKSFSRTCATRTALAFQAIKAFTPVVRETRWSRTQHSRGNKQERLHRQLNCSTASSSAKLLRHNTSPVRKRVMTA